MSRQRRGPSVQPFAACFLVQPPRRELREACSPVPTLTCVFPAFVRIKGRCFNWTCCFLLLNAGPYLMPPVCLPPSSA